MMNRLGLTVILVACLAVLAEGPEMLEAAARLRAHLGGLAFEGTECSFQRRTGLPCMGCGGTRAFERAARGDVFGALSLNPLGAWTALSAGMLAIGAAAALWTRRARIFVVLVVVVSATAPMAVVGNALRWWLSTGTRTDLW
jgi:hypothetical protein